MLLELMLLSQRSLSSPRTRFLCVLSFNLCILFLSIERSSAQPKTSPAELKALSTMLGRWGKQATWNTTGDPCSGAATDTTSFDDTDYNPFVKCNCDNTTCHITELKVYGLDVVGAIPDELQELRHLTNLNLARNYLTGPLPAFIGNLTFLQYFSVGINALSGPLPAELGKLQNLKSLGIGANNFSGPIPLEFGNLTSLQQLYVDSGGYSGKLPASLSKLKNMQIFRASDNNFSGKMPDFVTSWPNLNILRFQGNSFEGPIPSSYSTLTQVTDLRIGDIVNGSSSLAFISNLTSLTSLILRNCKISDTMPSKFASFTTLQKLDLSFNNITGLLPPSLFNLNSLKFLFLGNNSLSGSIPTIKSTSLSNIDLSYNQLSGSFPPWASQANLQLNLVANNFFIGNSNSSVLAPGLVCLQSNVPCNRDTPIYSSFGINCGGNTTITGADGTMYDSDNANLSTASYFVTNPYKWGVSCVGSFADAPGANYITNNLGQFQNTLDLELFQTSRMSPSSLRYYGLGLENGNYSVKLQFAEKAFPNSPTWWSLGRRVFNIYVQGNLVAKDFDIRKAAGGLSFKAVVREYVAPVTDNFLEIHFFWAGKGTCGVPTEGYYGPSISAISVFPSDFIPTVSNKPPSTSPKSDNMGMIVGIVVGVGGATLLAVIGILILRQRRRRLNQNDEELSGMAIRPNTFSYAELRAATNNFNHDNLLGEGGFGAVYKGKLSDGKLVAVKQLSVQSHQGKRQFMAEIGTISAVQHRNLVKLYGCCIEGVKRLVVYEYLENTSLDHAIFGNSNLHLDWPTRFQICLGTARGLAYLHEESRIRIVHRDVKSSNILLDADLNPKLSDFGLAKLYDDNKTHITTKVAGTIGYLAPEYAMRGHLTEKADVFGFGVVVLEVLSGRPNADMSLEGEKVYLLEWAWHLHEQRCDLELVDPKLSSYIEEEANRLINVALLCIQSSPMLRPSMSRVVAMLVGDMEVAKVTTRPGYLTELDLKNLSSNFTSSDSLKVSTSRYSQENKTSDISMVVCPSSIPSPSQPLVHYGEV